MFRKEKMNNNNHHYNNNNDNYSNDNLCDVGSSSFVDPLLSQFSTEKNYFVDHHHHYYVGPSGSTNNGGVVDELGLTREFKNMDIGMNNRVLSNNSNDVGRFGRDLGVDCNVAKVRPGYTENLMGFEGFGNGVSPVNGNGDRNYRMLLADRMSSGGFVGGDSVGSYSPYVGGAGAGSGSGQLIHYPLKEREEYYGNGVGSMRGNKVYGDRLSMYNCNDYVGNVGNGVNGGRVSRMNEHFGNGGLISRGDVGYGNGSEIPVQFPSMYGPPPLVDDYLQQYRAEEYKELLNSWANPQNYGALLQNYGGQVLGDMGVGGLNSLGSSPLIHPRQALSKGNALYNTMREKLRAVEQRYGAQHMTLLKNGSSGHSNHTSGRRKTMQKIAERSFDLNGSLQLERSAGIGSPVGSCDSLVFQTLYSSLAEVKGNIHLMAKDQHGCRFLQKKFEDGSFEDVQTIFNEIIDHVVELMIDPFGNYLVQKLLDVCNEEQRMKIVHVVTKDRGELVRICLNTHGTRVVQKLIDSLRSRKQISLIIRALEPGFLDLIKDLNGNHVVQRCLQCLNYDDNKFIFDAASKFCVEIATHRHGCCVLQRCIAHSNGDHRKKLIEEICSNGLALAQDPFGNYVVQYIIELKIPSAAAQLISQFEGHYVQLAMQKFSSHVVEKCLKFIEESQARIVYELLRVPHFEQLLQDPFANYVVQSALEVTKGIVNDSLVTAVRPHSILRTNPYCKKIFTRGLIKK
ncbi:uncharacterized protein LOC141585854 [Silene latifolia]|uniref:uncharacterized protein LOC141585854 n=1 Tax=Silene latifolia TaxID=37657 RepID=UPI003D7797E3